MEADEGVGCGPGGPAPLGGTIFISFRGRQARETGDKDHLRHKKSLRYKTAGVK
jgi:hypothetical protein